MSTELALTASHSRQTRSQTTASLRAWTGSARPDFEGARKHDAAAVVRLSRSAARSGAPAPGSDVTATADGERSGTTRDGELALLRFFVERLTGVRMQVFDASQLKGASAGDAPAQATAAAQPAGFGVELDVAQTQTQTERMQFAASGSVQTADGRSLRFELTLSVASYSEQRSSLALRAGDAVRKDPLVLNLAGDRPQLNAQRFSFDIDGDGQREQLPTLADGNGFLALDINANGAIDSGRELFGAQSGDGFAELSQYDDDHNGVIDDNDAVFARLKIWSPAPNDGPQVLSSLRALGVGALLLQHTATPLTLRANEAELGAVRSTGVYLSEAGAAGVMQQIDLVV